MKQILMLSVLLLGTSWAVAQNYPTTSNQGGASGQATAGGTHTTVMGCLSASGSEYTLTDANGMTYHLSGDTSKLADHVGHEVKITGTAGAASAGGGNDMGQTAASGHTLEISSVKHVSKTCKTSGATGEDMHH